MHCTSYRKTKVGLLLTRAQSLVRNRRFARSSKLSIARIVFVAIFSVDKKLGIERSVHFRICFFVWNQFHVLVLFKGKNAIIPDTVYTSCHIIHAMYIFEQRMYD